MKVGIACDKYKLKKFEEELTKNKIVFSTGPGLTKDTAYISAHTYNPSLVKKICEEVELFFGGQIKNQPNQTN